jgi:hypothetical protein
MGHSVSHVRQMEIHAAETSIPEPSPVETGIRTAKLKSCKSPGTEQLPAELIQAEAKHYGLRSLLWNMPL